MKWFEYSITYGNYNHHMEAVSPNISPETIYELAIETTKLLNERQDDFKNITWTDGEANLEKGFSDLACKCCKIAWETVIVVRYPMFKGIEINCTNPDISMTFIYSYGKKIKDKIELKSGKSEIIPGSTISKLNINQPLIWCLRPSTNEEPYKIRCSQYHSVMGESETDLFQDRTPRPSINFKKMNEPDNVVPFVMKDKQDWIPHYANCALYRINNPNLCKHSWQDDHTKYLQKKIIEEFLKNTSLHQLQILKTQQEQAAANESNDTPNFNNDGVFDCQVPTQIANNSSQVENTNI